MAVHLHNPESLQLPSLFLSEHGHGDANKSTTEVLWEEQDLRYGSGSSEACSDETGDEFCDPEQDDYMAELTRQMAHYMFQEDDKDKLADSEQQKGFSGSPQSTLWSPLGSSLSGHNRPSRSREPSPPVTDDNGWNIKNPNQPLTDYQIRAIQFYKLKQEQAARKPLQSSANWGRPQQHQYEANKEGPKTRRPLANPWSSHSNPETTQQQNFKLNLLQTSGSGMRAVFLNGSGSRRSSCGTGVFLPRGDCSNSSESRKKPGCSTVLIPARVAQALKLHFDQVGAVSRPNTYQNQNRHSPAVAPPPPAAKHQCEMRLPQEWTY